MNYEPSSNFHKLSKQPNGKSHGLSSRNPGFKSCRRLLLFSLFFKVAETINRTRKKTLVKSTELQITASVIFRFLNLKILIAKRGTFQLHLLALLGIIVQQIAWIDSMLLISKIQINGDTSSNGPFRSIILSKIVTRLMI